MLWGYGVWQLYWHSNVDVIVLFLRQLALQRIQEQEREMQMRQEQQKQQYLMGGQYGTYMTHGQQFPPPNTAPSVGAYHGYQYGQQMMPPVQHGIPQSAPPQMAHAGK